MRYTEKLTIEGNVFRFFQCTNPVRREEDISGEFQEKVESHYNTLSDEEKAVYKKEVSYRRARKAISSLINLNFYNTWNTFFLTLTFADRSTSVEDAWKALDVFIKRLRRQAPGLKYVAVLELQNDGTPHFHLIYSCGLLEWAEMVWWWAKDGDRVLRRGCRVFGFREDCFRSSEDFKKDGISRILCHSAHIAIHWEHGFVEVHQLERHDNVGAYITKYLSKGLSGRSWSSSRNLKRAGLTIYDPVIIQKVRQALLLSGTVSQVRSYEGDNPIVGCFYLDFYIVNRRHIADVQDILMSFLGRLCELYDWIN